MCKRGTKSQNRSYNYITKVLGRFLSFSPLNYFPCNKKLFFVQASNYPFFFFNKRAIFFLAGTAALSNTSSCFLFKVFDTDGDCKYSSSLSFPVSDSLSICFKHCFPAFTKFLLRLQISINLSSSSFIAFD